jgi:predicted nucleic acid-binding protein
VSSKFGQASNPEWTNLQQEVTEEESIQLRNDILLMPIRYFPHGPFISTAFDLVRKHKITIYDGVYLALAVEQGAVLFSADEDMCRIARKLFLIQPA